jgi:hypothetical protein
MGATKKLMAPPICPTPAPAHRAQKGKCLPFTLKQRSGMPWHPNVKSFSESLPLIFALQARQPYLIFLMRTTQQPQWAYQQPAAAGLLTTKSFLIGKYLCRVAARAPYLVRAVVHHRHNGYILSRLLIAFKESTFSFVHNIIPQKNNPHSYCCM